MPTAGTSAVEWALARAVAALGGDDFAPSLANFLRLCAPFDNFVVLAYRGEGQPVVLYREYTDPLVFDAMDSEYLTAAYLLDPFHKAHLEQIPHGIYRLLDLAPDQFKRSSYYQVYYQKTTLIDEIAALGYTPTGCTITACLGTDATSGKFFPRRAMANLRRFEPVIIALMERHWANLCIEAREPPVDQTSMLERLVGIAAHRHGVKLSRRQAEVALHILQGHSSISIGLILGISPHTVKVFRKQLYAKCAVSSQVELFAMMMPLMAEASDADAMTG